jgi:uncharacterized protein involved in propanediol utilization
VSASKFIVQVVLAEDIFRDVAQLAERISAMGPRVSSSGVVRRCVAAALPVLAARVRAMEAATEPLREAEAQALCEALR